MKQCRVDLFCAAGKLGPARPIMLFSETTSALELGGLFETNRADPREVAEFFLERARRFDPQHAIYLHVTEDRARKEAEAAFQRAKSGTRLHALDGVPLSWKDNIDSARIATSAGSLVLRERIPEHDAEVLAGASGKGAVCLGKTNMTEFAFSGLGINPLRGTPANTFDKKIARAPGGSSSGAGISLSLGLAAGAIGTDTGGSVRIPASWNGLVGLKTTEGRISLDGILPLAPSFDTVGPLARNVADAAALLSLIEGHQYEPPATLDLSRAKFCLPGGVGWSELDDGIAFAMEAALNRLDAAGARIIESPVPAMDEIDALAWGGGASRLVYEAHAAWGDIFSQTDVQIFAPIRERLMAGAEILPAALHDADLRRAEIRHRYLAQTVGFDAVILPGVAISPPAISTLEQGGPDYFRANRMALRNTTMGNQLGLCAITLPVGFDALGMPVGMMIHAAPNEEKNLLALAASVESCLRGL